MLKFEELFGQGLLVYILGKDHDAIEVLGYTIDEDDHVVIHYVADVDGEDVTRTYTSWFNMYEFTDEIVYYGSHSHT